MISHFKFHFTFSNTHADMIYETPSIHLLIHQSTPTEMTHPVQESYYIIFAV